jgi:ABC-type amino acid transport substrate-binding protein
MDVLAAQATLHFLLKDAALNRGMQRMVCVGEFDTHVADYLAQHAERPVEFLRDAPAAPLQDALLYVSDRLVGFDPDVAEQQARNLHVVRERDLCERFGLATA